MIQIRRILCPTDFSEASRRALDHAVALAKRYDAAITLFHVASWVPVGIYAPGPPMLSAPILASAERKGWLKTMEYLAETEAGSAVPIEVEVSEGSPADRILAKARATTCDLLVMGTHGRSGVERFLLGSVAENVLRESACPVLCVPPHAPDVVPAPPGIYTRIVCGIDFSDCSMRALDYAAALAQEADARLTIVHVKELGSGLPYVLRPVPDRRKNTRDAIDAPKDELTTRLEDALPRTVRDYCTVETIVTSGTPCREILRIAANQHSELIVLGIRRRRTADLLVFGSTAQRVLRQTQCPVLTLRSG